MPHLIMFVGLPASGKSTWRANMPLDGYDQLSTDDLIESHAKAVGLTYDEVFKDYMKIADGRFWNAVEDGIREKRNLIIDRTNLTFKTRRRVMGRVTHDYSTQAIVFLPPVSTSDKMEHSLRLRSREGKNIPPHIIETMIESFELPTREEGFDSIAIFDIWGNPVRT